MVLTVCVLPDFVPPQMGSSWAFCSVEHCECRSVELEHAEVGGMSKVI